MAFLESLVNGRQVLTLSLMIREGCLGLEAYEEGGSISVVYETPQERWPWQRNAQEFRTGQLA
jgi:hypothetical protein